jgi:ribosomal protein S18 acetylase RimI-like enzyme
MMSEETDIIRLCAGNEQTVRYLLQTLKTTSSPADEPPSAESVNEILLREDIYLLIAGTLEEPVGFLLAYRIPRIDRDCKMICLYELEVHQQHRRKGFAASLVREMKKICRENDIMKMWVSTEADNRAAAALYTAAGFNPNGGAASLEFSWSKTCEEGEVEEPWVPDF